MSEKLEMQFYSNLNEQFKLPSRPSRCEWHLQNNNKSTHFPHSKQSWKPNKRCSDISAAIGNTPLVKLNRIPQSAGLKCNIYAKCEYLNPGGSAKDRVAKRMIEDAERQGLLKPGMTVIESSSGNAGIALALQAAIKGYKAVIIISEYTVISSEKLAVLNALGANIVRTPLSASIDSPDGFIGVATKLRKEIPNSIILDQFANPSSPLAHYDTTAEEILDQLDGNVDMAVIGVGTGGTITGIGRKLKEHNPNTKIIGGDPVGSTLALPEKLNETDETHFEVDGIGFCFVSTVLDRSIVDQWIKTTDKESMIMARRLIREEGLLVGNSSGAVLAAALRAGKNLSENQNIVLIFADGIRNYLSTFLLDPWMEYRGYTKPANNNNLWWWERSVKDLHLRYLFRTNECNTCEQVLDFMSHNEIKHIGVNDKDGCLVGVVSKRNLIKGILTEIRHPYDKISHAMVSQYSRADSDSSLGLVSRILDIDHYAIIIQANGNKSKTIAKPLGIVYISDVLDYVNSKERRDLHTVKIENCVISSRLEEGFFCNRFHNERGS